MADRNELLVTSGKLMRQAREEGVVVPFPSGNNYRIRIPGAAGLLKRGQLPNALLAFVTDAFYSGMTEDKYDAFFAASDRADNARETMASLKAICEEMFMEPRVVDEPTQEGEIGILDVPPEDQIWAFRLAFVPVQAVHPFRAEPAADVVSVARPEVVPQTTEP